MLQTSKTQFSLELVLKRSEKYLEKKNLFQTQALKKLLNWVKQHFFVKRKEKNYCVFQFLALTVWFLC